MFNTREEMTVRELVDACKLGTVEVNLAMQRGLVWSLGDRINLIHSILSGYPIPDFFAHKLNGVYYVLDGKQRTVALKMFLEDKFALNEKLWKGDKSRKDKDYKGLSEEDKAVISNYKISFRVAENIEEKEVEAVFKALNNGIPLSRYDTLRLDIGVNPEPYDNVDELNVSQAIQYLKDHEFFRECISIGAKDRAKFVDEQIILHGLMLDNKKGNTGLSSSEMKHFVTYRLEEKIFNKAALKERADYLLSCFSDYQTNPVKYLKRSAVPIIWYCAKELVKKHNLIDEPSLFRAVANKFFTEMRGYTTAETKLIEAYTNAAGQGSAKISNVEIRRDNFRDFFKVYTWDGKTLRGIIQDKAKNKEEVEETA